MPPKFSPSLGMEWNGDGGKPCSASAAARYGPSKRCLGGAALAGKVRTDCWSSGEAKLLRLAGFVVGTANAFQSLPPKGLGPIEFHNPEKLPTHMFHVEHRNGSIVRKEILSAPVHTHLKRSAGPTNHSNHEPEGRGGEDDLRHQCRGGSGNG